jgi:hypothetical protein
VAINVFVIVKEKLAVAKVNDLHIIRHVNQDILGLEIFVAESNGVMHFQLKRKARIKILQ